MNTIIPLSGRLDPLIDDLPDDRYDLEISGYDGHERPTWTHVASIAADLVKYEHQAAEQLLAGSIIQSTYGDRRLVAGPHVPTRGTLTCRVLRRIEDRVVSITEYVTESHTTFSIETARDYDARTEAEMEPDPA